MVILSPFRNVSSKGRPEVGVFNTDSMSSKGSIGGWISFGVTIPSKLSDGILKERTFLPYFRVITRSVIELDSIINVTIQVGTKAQSTKGTK